MKKIENIGYTYCKINAKEIGVFKRKITEETSKESELTVEFEMEEVIAVSDVSPDILEEIEKNGTYNLPN
ncbi:hypothetical protein ABEV55_08420 [Aneurinibacillus thermoaerophilus]|uniref:hypothetical protein n=1 Tax=Aneurinibacillus thermoaerophilus TaxID=143495 RepID=UPI002E1FFFB2|nr:hypothetical protein [Aneurinibacillus thermoaerophilus]